MFELALILFIICITTLSLALTSFRSIFDKILMGNAINNIIIILLLALGIMPNASFFIDIVIIYIICSIVAFLGFLRFFGNNK